MDLICANLCSAKLILVEGNGMGNRRRIRLNVGQDDVQYALKDIGTE